jgi:UDP-N-acetylglucosamine 2-epimerase
MKVCSVVGARPSFVKAALLHKELQKYCELIVINTGQHYDYVMAGTFFTDFEMAKPDYDIGVGSGSHAEQTASMMLKIEYLLQSMKPDMVIVMGDTNSGLAGALAAAKLGIPVAHVEAGPRQFDITIPEEVNRVIIDHISTCLFAPTQYCADVLLMENIPLERVWTTGDVMLDNFMRFAPKRKQPKHVLVTIHRPVNTDTYRLQLIVKVLESLGKKIVFPIHPRTKKMLGKTSLQVCEPVGYLDMMSLLAESELVITDSGGLQKEAMFAGVPCLTLDVSSPWPETIEAGCNMVVRPEHLVAAVANPPQGNYDRSIFGNGYAHMRMREIILGSSKA